MCCCTYSTSCRRVAATICLRPLQVDNTFVFIRQVAVPACWLFKTSRNKLTFDLLTFKVVSESRVTWATSVLILVFLGLAVLELRPMYATDRRQTKASLNASALWERRHNNAHLLTYLLQCTVVSNCKHRLRYIGFSVSLCVSLQNL